ncbi:hypothetical protein ANN_15531 [Periplaneta americana]|uniref:Sodium-coupled monocarboxylate transporter 2 n=1 Tax=Periplaneta americana TaxID=6978 RepID=A0ABQ8SGQ8_PERAM|nr:hypothetical protein ANN_15531 [Periplaneta americana]
MDYNSTLGDTGDEKMLMFGWLDFIFFILMLGLSTLIGIYFGIWGKKEDTPKEYLHGGKTMSTAPVAVSLMSSFLSGIMMMGSPTEVYLYGTLYWLVSISIVFVGLMTNFFFLPVFYELQVTSTYEYLQLRFNRHVRIMASLIWTISLLLYIPIVVYVPALALGQVTGVNIHVITLTISVICIFYTMLGGIKAVVWTDLLQGVVMVVASIVVIILGVNQLGGFGVLWERSQLGGRIRIFEMSVSPFKRMTFWTVVIGKSFGWLGGVAVSQSMVQKFMALPTYSKARTSLFIFCLEVMFVTTISCLTGLLIYARYYDCDPISTKAISRPDQLLPYYVMDISQSLPGLPGLFVAGIFSASLSTMSSSLNSLSATLFEDFIRPCLKNKISDKTANNIIKCLVIIAGAVCVLNVLVVDKLGSVLQLSMSLSGFTGGAMIGLFSFGMSYPRGNAKGALAGSISSLLIMGWIVFGAQKEMAEGRIKQPLLPTSVEGCGYNVTVTTTPSPVFSSDDEVFVLYHLSFMYFCPVGILIVFVVGAIVSHLTEEPEAEKVKPVFFTPIVRKYYMKKRERSLSYSNKATAEKELVALFSQNQIT